MPITLEVLGAMGHRKYEKLTPEQAEQTIADIEAGRFEGARAGQYYVLNKNTHKLVGKVGLADNQELIVIPAIRGG